MNRVGLALGLCWPVLLLLVGAVDSRVELLHWIQRHLKP